MADSFGGSPQQRPPSFWYERENLPGDDKPDPLPAIAHRLMPLVHDHLEWWRAAVRRWAKDAPRYGNSRVLPVPFPETLTPDERLAVLAAIYDAHTTEVARIDPWPVSDLPPVSATEGPIPVEFSIAIRYATLRDERIPKLRHVWNTHETAVNLFIVEAEQALAGVKAETAAKGQGDKAGDDSPAAVIAEQPSLEARALALLTDHPDWTDTRIAQVLQCNRGSLYRLDKFTAARDLLKRNGMASADRGSKADGRIEAWESNE